MERSFGTAQAATRWTDRDRLTIQKRLG